MFKLQIFGLIHALLLRPSAPVLNSMTQAPALFPLPIRYGEGWGEGLCHSPEIIRVCSGFLRRRVEDLDLAEPGHRTTMTHGIGLLRFAFAVIRCAIEFVGALAPK